MGYASALQRTGGKQGEGCSELTHKKQGSRLLLQTLSLPDTQDWTHVPAPPCALTVVDPDFQDALGTLCTVPELTFMNYQGS